MSSNIEDWAAQRIAIYRAEIGEMMERNWGSVLFDEQIFQYPLRHSEVADLAKRGLYEPEVTDYLKSLFTRDTIFFDIGAHYGYYTLLAAKRVGRVVAFEPRSKAARILKANVEANSYNNVIIVPVPLFRKSVKGLMVLDQFMENPKGNIYAQALDDLNYGVPNVMKIDVEGAECDVLMGALRTIEAYKPDIVVELHAKGFLRIYNHGPACLQEIFSSIGYVSEKIGERAGEIFLKAWKA